MGGASDYRDAVLRAANLGDDADTTAAIAGQLAGARWGMSSIPARWRSRIVSADRIVALGERLHAAATGGATPRWPHDDFIHAWWVEPGVLLAGEYPGNKDSRRAAEKVNLLVDHGVRTFVDLTTPEDRLEEYADLVTTTADARRLDLRHVPHPIPDLGVVDDAEYDRILASIRDATSRGGVYIHCWGGVGRTATVVGCLQIENGLNFDETMTSLDELRSGTRKAARSAPETEVQRDVLRRRVGGRDGGRTL